MPSLALMEQGITLGVDGELFRIEREGERIQEVRMGDVDEVLVFGSVSLTPAAVAALLQRGIDTVFLSLRGRYRGRLVGKPGRNVELRLAQFDRLRDPGVAVPLARALVGGKIANQRALLLRSQREQASTGSAQGASTSSAQGASTLRQAQGSAQERREDLAEAIAGMRRLLETLEVAETVDAVRGFEGQAAALYFGAFGKCIRNPEFSFTVRSRRPPRDPVNAMLSFGYTLLGTLMESAVLKVGLDPMVGVFHAPEYGRPSLVLDLIEEFRPVVVDALTLRVVNRREVTPEDFEELHDDAEFAAVEEADATSPSRAACPESFGTLRTASSRGARPEPRAASRGRGVWLGASGRKVFFRAWGRRLRETHFYAVRRQTLMLEEIMQQQVYQLARVLAGETSAYQAFVVR